MNLTSSATRRLVAALLLLLPPFASPAAPSERDAIRLQGLHAYPAAESVVAGEEIAFHVSSEHPYRFRVTKLGPDVGDDSSDVTVFSPPEAFPPLVQPIHPGSWIRVAKNPPPEEKLEALTVECWVRPWRLDGWQGIVTRHDYPENCGYGLFLDGSGRAVFLLGSGGAYEKEARVVGPKLEQRGWHHLAGTWDGDRAVLWVDGVNAGEWSPPVDARPRSGGSAPFRIGAYGDGGLVKNFLDGDLAMPAIHDRALDAGAIAARVAARGLTPPPPESLVAFWPLDEERGNRVADATGHGFDGEIVNLGNWMIGGPSFDGAAVGRYDESYDPASDPDRGHGLRLASDDLYDCGWKARHTWKVPEDAVSGIYAAWFDFERDGVDHRYPVTFVVRKPSTAEKAPLVVMCSTTTWRAYGGTPFARNAPRENRYWKTGGVANDPANPPAYNFYRDHAAGQPSYQLGLRIPWPAAGPDVLYSEAEVGYSHLTRGERFTHAWLEKQGYDFDVVTNLDLHRDPELLEGYRALVINGHDEYWSREMYEGLDRYLRSGGKAAVLSGNTMFWRISVDDELGVIECRKYGPNIGGRKFTTVGEIYHSHDGRRGGLMRNCGLPPWRNIGLECSGWWGGSNNGVYTAETTEHFLFREPERIDFSDRAFFGGAKSGLRKAGGHEGDIRLSSYAPPDDVPDGAAMPEEPPGIVTLASLKRENARVLDYFANFGTQEHATLVDMIYWERPEGGTVFNAGAIGFGWTLDVDPKQTKLMRNVLFHLAGVKAKTPYDPEWSDPAPDAESGAAAAPGPEAAKADRPAKPPRAVLPETDHALVLRAADAGLAGESVRVNPKHGALAWWQGPDNVATWKVREAKNGRYVVVIDYAVPDGLAGQDFAVAAGDEKLTARAPSTGGWGKWSARAMGEIAIDRPDLEITFSPSTRVKGEDLLDLRSLRLIPVGSPRLNSLEPLALPSSSDSADASAEPKSVAGNEPSPVAPGDDGSFELTGRTASLHGEGMNLLPGASPAIAGWRRVGERAAWSLRGIAPGRYDLHVEWAMPRLPGGLQKASLLLDGEPLFTGPVRTTEGENRYARFVLGTINLPAGDHELSFGPGGPAKTWGRLRQLRLVPAAEKGAFTPPPLTVPEGFVVEPAALPPLVSHPMMACLDDRGRMFVAESAGVNAQAPELLETRPHRILLLEDKDDDGLYDRSTVFADDLVLPNGVQWHDGALYVCSPPYVWRFEDTEDDGVADERTPVGGKFGFNGMSSAFHGPVLGADGRLYYCGGQHGWTLGDTSPGLDLEGPWTSRAPGVFSMWPDGTDPENLAQGGMANPVEVTFSPEGEVFGTVAVYENLNGRTDALLHWIHGSVYNLRRGPPVHPATSGRLLAPMSRRGWVAPAGLCRYRSGGHTGGFGSEYRDDIFLTEFNTHRVYRIRSEREGASYVTTDEVFLESSSPYTHFTDVFEGADGSLLVVDTGGWFLYGCPTSAISRPEIEGAIYRIRRIGAKPAAKPRGGDLDWENPSSDWLDDPRFAVRDRTLTELAKGGAAAVPSLRNILNDSASSERHRRNAVWTLTRIDHAEARVAAREALDDPSSSVRLTAARSASTRRDAGAATSLVERLADEAAAVRREAATALGRIDHAPAVPALFEAVRENGGRDPYLDHSLIYALIEIDDGESTRLGLGDADPHVRRAALIACAERASSRLTGGEIAPHLGAEDPDLRAEALRIATARPELAGPLVGFLRDALAAERTTPAIREALLAFSENAEVQRLVADALGDSATRGVALGVMGRTTLKSLPDAWLGALRKELANGADARLLETVDRLQREDRLVAADLGVDWNELAEDESGDPSTRLAAFELALAEEETREKPGEPAFRFLAARLGPSASNSHRARAARMLTRLDLTNRQQIAVAERLAEAGPLEIESLLRVFEAGAEPGVLDRLADSLGTAPGFFGLPVELVDSVLGSHPQGRELVAKLRSAASERESRLDELVADLAGHEGDPVRGADAFAKATCIVCHKARGEGGVSGPELTTIGAIRSERDLLEAIAFPSATYAREYEPFVVTLEDGSVQMGRLGEETANVLELIDALGESRRIPLDRIARREMASVSMMPPGLERLLTPAELADLVAYLKSLQ
ncbi:MAG: PVC-type heme-binding CxxCH protein [Verrucomicrobiales bacterium]